MCRLAAYLGEPLCLAELVATPRHSLLRQAQHAEQAQVAVHGDGFGIGWYGAGPDPSVYRQAQPAWHDDRLLALAQTVRSHLFFAHVRAATSGAPSRRNCHPFRHGRHLFMHNGQIGGWSALRHTLQTWLPADLQAARRGATDSEWLFMMVIARLRDGLAQAEAVVSVLHDVQALMEDRGIAEPLRFAAVLSDGKRLHAFRLASDAHPPSLYLRRCARGTLLASEPLCDGGPASRWQALPAGAVVTLDAKGCDIATAALAPPETVI
jgi:glutamine amidotransferase